MPEIKSNAVRIFYTSVDCRPDMSKCDWAFTFDYDEELQSPRHLRLPYYKFVGNAGENLVKKNLNLEEIKKQKTKFCAFIYSNNVPFRNNFFKELSKYKRVDAPGNCMRNMPPFGQQKKTKERFVPGKVKEDWQKEKIDFLKPYKFVISFEGSSSQGYTTEKIYHPMLASCIPIYWGNPLISRDFNTKSFVNYFDFETAVKESFSKFLLKIPLLNFLINRSIERRTISKMIKHIIKIDKDDRLYEEYLRQPWYPDNKLTPYVEDKFIEKRFKEIFG
jgi:alpha(1,3/1,4) fucosyltransferase